MKQDLKENIKLEENKKLNVKKVITLVIILLLICAIVWVIIEYIMNEQFRTNIDKYLFMKEIQEDETKSILIENENNSFVCVYDRYIGILSNNILNVYNRYAEKEMEFSLTISSPIFESNNNYLAVGEKNGEKIYMIKGKNLIWQADVDGQISKITVNKNGYVAVSIIQTSNKAAVVVYNPEGKELFKTHLSNTYAIDTDISNDNKYLTIAEININGTTIQSNIKIISFDKVQNDPENAIIYNKPSDTGKLIISLKYCDDGSLMCMYDSEITMITDGNESKIIEYDNDTLFANINMNKKIVEISTSQDVNNADSILKVIDVISKSENDYTISEIPKELLVKNNKITVNTGMYAYFINSYGMLIKKYISKQEIKEIVMGDYIAAIVYRNKVNIIEL